MTDFHTSLDDLTIGPVEKSDELAVHGLISSAFGQATEAELVHELRSCAALVLERVARDPYGKVIGHVAFSRVTGAGRGHRLAISCLAPVSILPEVQRQGVGSALIRACLDELKAMGEDLVVVLGPPPFYTKLGFDPALARKITAPYAGDAFMAMNLTEAGRRDLPVEITFASPFEAFE